MLPLLLLVVPSSSSPGWSQTLSPSSYLLHYPPPEERTSSLEVINCDGDFFGSRYSSFLEDLTRNAKSQSEEQTTVEMRRMRVGKVSPLALWRAYDIVSEYVSFLGSGCHCDEPSLVDFQDAKPWGCLREKIRCDPELDGMAEMRSASPPGSDEPFVSRHYFYDHISRYYAAWSQIHVASLLEDYSRKEGQPMGVLEEVQKGRTLICPYAYAAAFVVLGDHILQSDVSAPSEVALRFYREARAVLDYVQLVQTSCSDYFLASRWLAVFHPHDLYSEIDRLEVLHRRELYLGGRLSGEPPFVNFSTPLSTVLHGEAYAFSYLSPDFPQLESGLLEASLIRTQRLGARYYDQRFDEYLECCQDPKVAQRPLPDAPLLIPTLLVGGHIVSLTVFSGLDAAATASGHRLFGSLVGIVHPFAGGQCELYPFLPCAAEDPLLNQTATAIIKSKLLSLTLQQNTKVQALEQLLETVEGVFTQARKRDTWQEPWLVVCSFPTVLCPLLRVLFPHSMLVVDISVTILANLPTSALDPAASDEDFWRIKHMQDLKATLEHPLSRACSLAPNLEDQVRQQMGVEAPALHRVAFYTGQRYAPPATKGILIWSVFMWMGYDGAELWINAFLQLGRKLKTRYRSQLQGVADVQHTYQDFATNYSAVVFVPRAMELTAFLELYSMGVPLFMPSHKWMTLYMRQMLTLRCRSHWWSLRPEFYAALPEGEGGGIDPWIDGEASRGSLMWSLDYWYSRSHYGRFPFLQIGDSMLDLVLKLDAADSPYLLQVSEAMLKWNAAMCREALKVYRRWVGQAMAIGAAKQDTEKE